jgi:hypothetical protein
LNTSRKTRSAIALLGLLAIASIASAADEMPELTPEGLVLMENTELHTVYVRPGASLDQYTKVVLFDAYIAFRKNWDRDYNRNLLPGTTRVRADDMEKIKVSLAEEFKTVFTEELQEKRGYEIVETAGHDVLVVKPAIINLDVTAPQLRGTGLDRNVITSAGQMTLWMELYDSTTGEIIARAIDPAVDNRNGFAYRSSMSDNRIAARKMLQVWAEVLGKNLGEIDEATTWDDGEEESSE